MSVPPIQPPLEEFARRPFSFYPPVLGIEHNEWMFQRATWSEVLVINTKTSVEVWVPRRFLGEVSRVEEPMMIVGLRKELEYKGGALWPHERRVIEIPKNAGNLPLSQASAGAAPSHAPVVGIRLEGGAESRVGLLIGAVLILGVLGCFLVVSVFRGREGNVTYVPLMQQQLGLTARDDYFAVERKVGKPEQDRWREAPGELEYRILVYPKRRMSIILMGKDRDSARYIGAMDENWKVVDSIDLPFSGNTRSMLNSLKRF